MPKSLPRGLRKNSKKPEQGKVCIEGDNQSTPEERGGRRRVCSEGDVVKESSWPHQCADAAPFTHMFPKDEGRSFRSQARCRRRRGQYQLLTSWGEEVVPSTFETLLAASALRRMTEADVGDERQPLSQQRSREQQRQPTHKQRWRKNTKGMPRSCPMTPLGKQKDCLPSQILPSPSDSSTTLCDTYPWTRMSEIYWSDETRPPEWLGICQKVVASRKWHSNLTTCFWGVITTIYDAGMTLHSHRSTGYGRSVERAEDRSTGTGVRA